MPWKEKFKSYLKSAEQGFIKVWKKVFCYGLSQKARIALWITMASLVIIAIILGTVLGSLKSVGPRSVGLHYSTVSGSLQQVDTFSGLNFAGLGGTYIQMPANTSVFHVSFTDQTGKIQNKTGDFFIFPGFNARTFYGSPLRVNINFTCQLKPSSYYSFINRYGTGWSRYLSFALPNYVRRAIATMSFYSMTNGGLRQLLEQQANNLTDFNFTMVGASLTLMGAPSSNMQPGVSTTIGSNLYTSHQNLSFSKITLSTLSQIDSTAIKTAATYLGTLYSYRDIILLQNTLNATDWAAGLTNLNTALGNTTSIYTFLWTYFQLYYNQTFRLEPSQIQNL